MPAALLDPTTPLPRLHLDSIPSRDPAETIPTPPPDSPLDAKRTLRLSRSLGNSELSYFLPSRADGVNDMYLHLGLTAPLHLVIPERVEPALALLRIRHPLLASAVEPSDDYHASFVYTAPATAREAVLQARDHITWAACGKDALIDAYLNGPRTLSQHRLSYLFISRPPSEDATVPLTPPRTPSISTTSTDPSYLQPPETSPSRSQTEDQQQQLLPIEIDLLICAAHFIGDGIALHTFANEFLQLLAGNDEKTGSVRTAEQLQSLLEDEWIMRCALDASPLAMTLPLALESGLNGSSGSMASAASKVDFLLDQRKYIGGQSFPRAATKQARQTIVPTLSFERDTTSRMLKKCKANGTSISHALFAACNVAWARANSSSPELPMMMYSAMNLRHLLPSQPSYWTLSIGYFNVVLPSFIPSSTSTTSTFWHRARSAKQQSAAATSTPMLVSRSRTMAIERGRRARRWARQDDGLQSESESTEPSLPPEFQTDAPSRALIGLSLLGNLDGMYKHASFANIKLHTLTTGSRQRPGGMLLFSYTFVGKLWLSFGWDVNGFEVPVVERFWSELLKCVEEFLASP